MIELEEKSEKDKVSSDSETSQESSRQNMRLKPPAIGIIETDQATDRSHMRSKTVLIPSYSKV